MLQNATYKEYFTPNMLFIKCDFYNDFKSSMTEVQRDIMQALLSWKNEQQRKPLIIQGARQIGKTYVMRRFGELTTICRHSKYICAM